MFDDGAPPHLISFSQSFKYVFFSSQISILDRERREKEKDNSIGACTCQQFHLWSEEIRELIIRKTTDLNKRAERKKVRERVNE
jgi:hypothetical protein